MASDSDQDPDLESLRSAVLASLKTKPGGTTSQGQSDENVTKSEGEENKEEDETLDEEDLHALRLAALKSKRDDSLPKAAPTTFERQGNLISIQIVDPEEERRKKEEEMKAKAQANATVDPELSKAAKPARFRRFDSSDSENDDDEEDDQRNSDESEDEKSMDSLSSSSSSKSESSSSSSKSSDSSSSESEKDSKSSSSSESESEVDEDKNNEEKQEESNEHDASRKQDRHVEVKDGVKSEKESKERQQSNEGTSRDEKSVKGSQSVKDRLGVRLPEGQSRRGSDKSARSSEQKTERGRDGHGRDDRRQRSDRKEDRRQNDRVKVSSNDRHRVKGHSGDLRDRLRQEKGRRDFQEKDRRMRGMEHSSRRRDENHELSKRIPNEVSRRTHERPRSGRRRDAARNNRTDTRQGNAEKNNNYTDRKTFGKDPSQRNSSNSKNENMGAIPQKSSRQNPKKASDSESLSDIPLESEEEKGDSDSENVRFRKGRHETKPEKSEHDDQSNSQSRIVMSLQLLTEAELKKADEKISKDFKRRRNIDEYGIDNSSKNINRGSGRIDLRTLDRRPRNSERRGQTSPDRTSRPRARGDLGRRKPRPSDFVSESESEDEDKTGTALRSQVSGAGDAGKRDRNFSKSESTDENSKRDDKKRDSKTERDERRRERRERREKRSKRRVVEEKPDSHATDEENGEEAVKQLSIRDRLGDRPVSGLRSSIKSRLGPKVSPSSPTHETKDAEVSDHPKEKIRKIEVSYRDSDHNFDNRLGDLGSIERTVEQEEKLITKPDDLRHKMKRKLHKTEEDQSSEEVVGVKRKVLKNNVWAEVLQERSTKERRGGSASPHRAGSRGRDRNEERQETKKEGKKKEDDEILEAKIKRIKEMNAAILEKQKQIQKEKELFDS